MTKTVLWIYTHPLRPEAGGTERITSLIMRGLSANGHKCLGILVVDPFKGELCYEGKDVIDLYVYLKFEKVDVVINQCGHIKEVLNFFLENGGKQWHEEGGRIISCLHFDPKPYSLHYLFLSKKNKNLHDYYVLAKSWLFKGKLEKQDQKRVGQIFLFNYDNSDYFVVLSDSFVPYVTAAMGLKMTPKLTAINNPLTFEKIADDQILDKKENVLLVVSRMYEYQKRISLILKAWEKLLVIPNLKSWTLKIVGDGENLNEYKEYCQKHNLKRVFFAGQQNPEEYYREAKIFLMTSQMEGWGLTLTESLQYGVVPVVFDICSAFHDIIIDGFNGFLIKDGKMSDFVNVVEKLISDHKKWNVMAKNALHSAEKFRLDKTIKRWENII